MSIWGLAIVALAYPLETIIGKTRYSQSLCSASLGEHNGGNPGAA
jgi:hypothetical protein